jgi:hypothetical protein
MLCDLLAACAVTGTCHFVASPPPPLLPVCRGQHLHRSPAGTSYWPRAGAAMAQSRAARRPAARPRTLRAARACCRPRPRAFAWLDRSLLAVCVLSGCFFFFLAKKNHTPHPACTHTYTHFATLKYDTMLPRIKWALYASTVLMSHMSCAVFVTWRFWGSNAQTSGVVVHIFHVPLACRKFWSRGPKSSSTALCCSTATRDAIGPVFFTMSVFTRRTHSVCTAGRAKGVCATSRMA